MSDSFQEVPFLVFKEEGSIGYPSLSLGEYKIIHVMTGRCSQVTGAVCNLLKILMKSQKAV